MQDTFTEAAPCRLISLSEVIRLTGRGRTKVYAEINAGRFPPPIKDGASSRWVLGEVTNWISQRVADRDKMRAA